MKEEVERSKIALAETCSRSKYNELVAAFEQAQVEKDRLALELVGAMSERDQLKQEKERAQWQESQANEIAVMEMQGYLEAERVKVTGLSKRLNQGKKDLEKLLQKFERMEKKNNVEMKKVELRFMSITFFHSSSFILIDKLSIVIPALFIRISILFDKILLASSTNCSILS